MYTRCPTKDGEKISEGEKLKNWRGRDGVEGKEK